MVDEERMSRIEAIGAWVGGERIAPSDRGICEKP
jgi:hypothetical protein